MTDEPRRFRSKESMRTYASKKTREFKWLEHKLKTATTPTAKDEAIENLTAWMANHPTFTTKILDNTLKKLIATKRRQTI